MTQSIVNQAFELYVETLALKDTDIETQHAKWIELYSKECELFDLMREFTPEQSAEYREMVRNHKYEDLQWDYMNGEYPDEY